MDRNGVRWFLLDARAGMSGSRLRWTVARVVGAFEVVGSALRQARAGTATGSGN
jgi:hypothetical protein